MQDPNLKLWIVAGAIVFVLLFIPFMVSRFLTTVEAGTIRLVSWLWGGTKIYKGPCKAKEIPMFTTGSTIPSKAINIDLDISDQTADVDRNGQPRPVKVRVLASAIVSVGDTTEMITTAANKFFAKPTPEQTSTLTDLLTSTGRRAINLLHHDELFNARAGASMFGRDVPAQTTAAVLASQAENDDRLAIIIKSSCSRELQDLGLMFNSLNIKGVQSDVADARRRQSAVEAKANADIVTADQERRSREAQLTAEQAINDKTRELEERKAQNAAKVATAEAEKQLALATLREAELRATQIAQANADAERVKVQAEASAEAEAIRLRTVGAAQAEAIRLVNAAIQEGGDAYLTLRQLEMLPQVVPAIAEALAQARMVTISGDGGSEGAAGGSLNQITSVIQTVLAAQLVNTTLRDDGGSGSRASRPQGPSNPAMTATAPSAPSAPAAAPAVKSVSSKTFPELKIPPVQKPEGDA